jgi:hypothetical protein
VKEILVIIGNYEKTRDLYEQSRTDADVWVFNEMLGRHDWIERADAVFQIHAEPIWRNPNNRTDPNHCQWLQTQADVPVYMQHAFADVPRAVKYPLDEISIKYLSNFNKRPYNSTPGYALALGIYQGYKEIEIYGVEMGTDTEYFWQREGFTFWLGVAVASGIKVTIHTDKLLNAPLYGYEGEISVPLEMIRARITELTQPARDLQTRYELQLAELDKAWLKFAVGAIEINDAIMIINRLIVLSKDFGILDGALQENERWTERAQMMIEVAGNYIFSRQEVESAYHSMQEKHKEITLTAYAEATRVGMIVSAIVKETDSGYRTQQLEMLKTSVSAYIRATTNMGMLTGGLAEDHAWLEYIDVHVRAMGGEKSVQALTEVRL